MDIVACKNGGSSSIIASIIVDSITVLSPHGVGMSPPAIVGYLIHADERMLPTWRRALGMLTH